MKKVLSAALSLAMTASFATGFAVMSSAEEITVDQNHVIPYVQPENIPTIDGKTTSENEWANALKITIDKNTPGPATSDIDGTGDTDETMNSASMEAYVLYSATLDGFETDDDIMWDYIPGDDPIGGLYFRFDVKDTTQAFAAGENGLGLLNLNATDCVQIALNGDPDNAGSGLTGKEWLYTFSGYTAGAPGVGEIPSGNGAWYEYWATGGGNAQTHGGYNVQIKTSMDVDFDPAYPLPEGDLSIDDPGYKEWKKQRDDAFEHITNYRGYTIEAFIEWEACNYGEGMFILPIEGQKLGMGLILINYMYEWEGSGPVNTRQALVWGKTDIGGAGAIWSDLSNPQLFPLYQLGSHDAEEPDPGNPDTSALEAAIAKAEALNPEDYTEDSFAAVTTALEAAKAALTGTQEEINAAAAALEDAISKLVKEEPSEDKIVGIEVTAPTKVNYLVDEEFVEDGFAVQNVYQSGKKEATTGTYEAPDMSTVGDKVVEVTAGEFTSSFTIRVSNKGDINADGKVSLADVMTAAKTAIITDQDANSAEVVFGDIVGNDNKVTLADVLKLAKVSVGKETIG